MDFSGLIAAYRPPSAIEQDVIESLNRRERSKRPLRHLADCIVHNCPPKRFIDIFHDEEDNNGEVDINGTVSKGLRLVHFAVFKHDEVILSYLLDRGADPNLMDDVGYTPIHLCAEKGYSDLIPLLLQYGARLRFTELNPGDHAFGDPPRATLADEPLRLAIKNTEHETALLLLEMGANPNATYTLGQEINLVDPTDLVSLEMLLDFGANPNSRDIQGLTPLMKACRNAEATEAVYLLIRYGARIILQCQRNNEFGIIKVIHRLHLGLVPEVMNIIVEACESFDVPFIENSRQMSDEHKSMLLTRALQPFPLTHIARLGVRRYFGWGHQSVQTIQSLPIPKIIKNFIFFEN